MSKAAKAAAEVLVADLREHGDLPNANDVDSLEPLAAQMIAALPWRSPPEGYQYFGCPACGMVYTLPGGDREQGPCCYCRGHTYNWHVRPGNGWTRTLPVVGVLDA